MIMQHVYVNYDYATPNTSVPDPHNLARIFRHANLSVFTYLK